MLEIGSVIDGKYKVMNKIGQGGMSVVYLAMNERANKTWAIKEVRRDGVQDYEVVRAGLAAETEMLRKLHHEGLPSIVDVIEDEDTFLVVMDYIEGNGLDKTLKEEGAQPQEKVVEWGIQLCDVLGYLHSQDPPIIYRDMKPSNIVRKPNGRVTLIDFGAAREFKGNRDEDTTCLGTRGYAAPEQYGQKGETTPRTDIYCLGATLYHLVTGCSPGEPPYEMVPIREIDPSLSSGLEQIIQKCTRPNPDERYASCAELEYDLRHFRELDTEYRRKQNRRWGLFLSCFMLSVLAGSLAVGFRRAEAMASRNTYESLVKEGEGGTDEEQKLWAYRRAIELNPGKAEAYLGLLEVLCADDVFTEEDDEIFRATLSPSHRTALKKDESGYAELAYRAALAYYYYYSPEGKSRAKQWCEDVLEAGASAFEQNGEAKVTRCGCLEKICGYYRDIGRKSITGDATVSYRDYWDDLVSLTKGNLVREDVAKTACLVYSELACQVSSHTTEFLDAGVSVGEMEEQLDEIEKRLESDFTETDKADLASEREALRETISFARLGLASQERGGKQREEDGQ